MSELESQPGPSAPAASVDDRHVESIANEILAAYARMERRICEEARRRHGPQIAPSIEPGCDEARRRIGETCKLEELRRLAADMEQGALNLRKRADKIEAARRGAQGADAA